MSKVLSYSLFTDFDISLFKSGKHYRLFEKFGAHITTLDGVSGTYFSVWAPSAKSVSVIGDFNYWDAAASPLEVRWDSSGIWEGFIPHVGKGSVYKYSIHSNVDDTILEKADPYANRCELPPKTASIVWEQNYDWKDNDWMLKRKQNNSLSSPFSVYEVHLDSWRKGENGSRLSYDDLKKTLVPYVSEMGFTHVEFMPIMEYPYDPSWGYQLTGYYAPSSRFGSPQDLKSLIDAFHEAGIGVILDWVPSHFPEDAHGLGNFDGSHLYEQPDRRKGYHPDWKSLIFNYERNEVRSFLISNAIFWLHHFHVDGLRVDAVASMLYLDYSREEGEWEPNIYGGRENLAAISFIKALNEEVYKSFPDVQTIAEESTSFDKVSRPIYDGGLGFGMKWMMGWMHDTLQFYTKETVYRKHHQNDITFSMTYAFSENFMLPLSHDEVVYGKRSILGRMPGDEWQRFANLRLLYSYMFTHPGAKLLFQGNEIGQGEEWNFQSSIDWHILQYDVHKGVQHLIRDLNALYKSQPALHEKQFSNEGFEWIDYNDAENSVLAFIRKGQSEKDHLIIIANMTEIPRQNYCVGLSSPGKVKEIFNCDSPIYSGTGDYKNNTLTVRDTPHHFRNHSVQLTLPPLGLVVLKYI